MSSNYLINLRFLEFEPEITLANIERYFRTFDSEYDPNCINEKLLLDPHLEGPAIQKGIRYFFKQIHDKYILIEKCQMEGDKRFVHKHYIMFENKIFFVNSLKDLLINRVQNVTSMVRDIQKQMAELEEDED